ncbi:hypothetical protein GQ53DRAFT_23909 [Thozetella sp. PMI_491]|nr:hypothetical protein GQ53DRAFT_23909 [Thozetella sp. PMI_491]
MSHPGGTGSIHRTTLLACWPTRHASSFAGGYVVENGGLCGLRRRSHLSPSRPSLLSKSGYFLKPASSLATSQRRFACSVVFDLAGLLLLLHHRRHCLSFARVSLGA